LIKCDENVPESSEAEFRHSTFDQLCYWHKLERAVLVAKNPSACPKSL